ncbi:acetate--CoA ligase family protein [Chloroflexota bacterium]
MEHGQWPGIFPAIVFFIAIITVPGFYGRRYLCYTVAGAPPFSGDLMDITGKQQTETIGRMLTEVAAKDWLRENGIPTVTTELATTANEAETIARKTGFPVALKIVSPDIIHKSDTGGVRLGLKNKAEVSQAFKQITEAARQNFPSAEILGVSVQPMAAPGTEVIIGMSKDAQLGPVLMFGLGGVWVELLKDVSFRIAPINRREAREMIGEIQGYQLLTGYRGAEPVNIGKLEDMLLAVSDFVTAHPEILELDLNPVFAKAAGATAVDARIILKP